MDSNIAVYKSLNEGESLPNLMQIILSSINDKLIIEVNYMNAGENKSERLLEAVGISYSHPRWYLAAWCHLREEYRMFRLDRISDIKTTGNKHTKAHPPLESLIGCDTHECLIEVVLHASKEGSKRFADR